MRTLAAILLVAVLPCAGAEFHYTNEGFSIAVPARWIELPPDTIRELRAKPADELPVMIEGLVHVFQTDDAPEPLTLPLVHVQVFKTGRVPDFFMWQMVRTNDPSAMIRRFLRDRGMAESNLRDLAFDTNRFTITVDAVHAKEQGRNRAFSRVFFTEEGALVVSALAHEVDYSKWAATFAQIVNSVSVPENLRYKLRELNLSSGWRDWVVILGGLGGLALLLGVWIYWTRVRGPSTLDY